MTKNGSSGSGIRKYKYWFWEWCEDREQACAYFFAANLNGLFRYHEGTHRVEKLCSCPSLPYYNELYRGGWVYGDKVYMLPRMAAEKLVVYHKTTGEAALKSLYPENPFAGITFGPTGLGYFCFIYQERFAFLLYRCSPICICMDLRDESMRYLTCGATGQELLLGIEYILVDDCVIAPVMGKNQVVAVDMKNRRIDVKDVGGGKDDYFPSIARPDNGGIFVLRGNDPAIMQWDMNTKTLRETVRIDMPDIRYDQLYRLHAEGNEIWMVPGLDYPGGLGCVYIWNLVSDKLERKDLFQEIADKKKLPVFSSEQCYGYVVCGASDDMFYTDALEYYKLDYKKRLLEKWDLPIPDGLSEEGLAKEIDLYQKRVRFNRHFSEWDYVMENYANYIDLEGFLAGVTAPGLRPAREKTDPPREIGKEIWYQTKKEL